jgi:hypothetical protein
MAGKTFTGIGLDDLLKENPPLPPETTADAVPVNPGEGEDAHSVNSEPTIVDAGKVAEGLQRLRSLQTIQGMPAAPPQGVSTPPPHGMPVPPPALADAQPELVADMGSSEPTKIGMPAARPTAVGRTSDLEPPGKQMVVQPDLRGTMFGHSVHLPEMNERRGAEDRKTPSGPVYTPPPQPGSPTTQLVPYQPPPPRMPSFHGVEPYPRQVKPFHRAGYSSGAYPSDDLEPQTQTIPPLGRRGYARAILVMFALALAALGTLAWMRYRAAEADDVRPAAPTAPATGEPQANAPTGAIPAASSAAAGTTPGAAEPAGPAAGAPGTSGGPGTPPGASAAAPAGVADRAGATGPSGSSAGSGTTPAPGARPSAAASSGARPASTTGPGTSPGPGARRSGEAGREPAAAPTEAAGSDTRRRPGRSDRRRAPAAEAPADDTAVKTKAPRKGGSSEEDPDATLPLNIPE